MTRHILHASLIAAFAAFPAHGDDKHHAPSEANAKAEVPLSEGEIRKVDKEAKKVTLRHGPLANLDMPAMTMVFQVADPSMLEHVKRGDKVRFRAEKIGGAYTLTRIEPAEVKP